MYHREHDSIEIRISIEYTLLHNEGERIEQKTKKYCWKLLSTMDSPSAPSILFINKISIEIYILERMAKLSRCQMNSEKYGHLHFKILSFFLKKRFIFFVNEFNSIQS